MCLKPVLGLHCCGFVVYLAELFFSAVHLPSKEVIFAVVCMTSLTPGLQELLVVSCFHLVGSYRFTPRGSAIIWGSTLGGLDSHDQWVVGEGFVVCFLPLSPRRWSNFVLDRVSCWCLCCVTHIIDPGFVLWWYFYCTCWAMAVVFLCSQGLLYIYMWVYICCSLHG